MRALVLTKSTGGLASYTRRLSPLLAARGLDQHVVCLSAEADQLAASLTADGIDTSTVAMARYRLNVVQDLQTLRQLQGIVSSVEPDVIVGHGSKSGFLARYIGRRAGIPAVYCLHSASFLERTQGRRAVVYRQLERLGSRIGGHIVTVCEATRRAAIEHHIADAERITTIHSGLTRDELGLASRQRCRPLETKPLRVGWSGRFEAQKDPVTFVRSVAEIDRRGIAVDVEMAGDGALLDSTERLSVELGLSNRIKMTGWTDDPRGFYHRADVLVVTSQWEGLPIAMLEAMALGAVPIATDVDGIPEAIDDGVSGVLVSTRSPTEVADAVERLDADRSSLTTMSQAARATVERRFTAERMADEWMALLDRVTTS